MFRVFVGSYRGCTELGVTYGIVLSTLHHDFGNFKENPVEDMPDLWKHCFPS